MNSDGSVTFVDRQFQQQVRDFDAPGQTIKSFATVIARKPCPADERPT